jgi:carbon monoxide dehydrogenase subunit G
VKASNSVTITQNGNGIVAEMNVAATLERVWHVLTSFEEMDVHLSALHESRVLRTEGNYRLVAQTGKITIARFPVTFRVVMDVVEKRPFLYFNQRAGSFAFFRGHWEVDPDVGGNGTRVLYRLEARSGTRFKLRLFAQRLNRMIQQNLQELAFWIDNPWIGK